MTVTQLVRQLAFGLAVACAATGATASSLSFTTVFGPAPPFADPGELAPGVGSFPSPAALGPLGNFTNFQVQNLNDGEPGGSFPATANEGQVLFFQNGGFYVGGDGPASSNPLSAQGEINLGGPVVNNRAYGVFGTGRSDFTFDPGVVDSITLQLRGTAEGLTIGSNEAFGQSLPAGTELAGAEATVLVYTNLGLQFTGSVSNDGFQTESLDISALPGDFITRVSLINEGPINSAIVLGELTVGTIGIGPDGFPIPEPGTLALLAMTSGLVLVGRRVR